jgi:hypothetical protein
MLLAPRGRGSARVYRVHRLVAATIMVFPRARAGMWVDGGVLGALNDRREQRWR